MGDRFVLIRIDSTQHRQAAGRKAIGNTGEESQMRAELARAVAGVLAGMNPEPIAVTEAEEDVLLKAADLVCLARTGVEYDYRGDVINAHAPEMPTRFAKQLTQIVRGAVAIGMDRADALRLAIRCARDSMPPLRLAIIEDLAEHPHSTTSDVRRRIGKPRNTVDRQLQALHMLGIAEVEEEEYGQNKFRWYYSLNKDITPDVLKLRQESFPDLSLHTLTPVEERGEEGDETCGVGSDKSGKDPSVNSGNDCLAPPTTTSSPPPFWPPREAQQAEAHDPKARHQGLCRKCRRRESVRDTSGLCLTCELKEPAQKRTPGSSAQPQVIGAENAGSGMSCGTGALAARAPSS
jgi:DNA-binding transcriptional ArsR family regulator